MDTVGDDMFKNWIYGIRTFIELGKVMETDFRTGFARNLRLSTKLDNLVRAAVVEF